MEHPDYGKAERELRARGWTLDHPSTFVFTDPEGRQINDPSPAELVQLASGTPLEDVLKARKSAVRIEESTINAAIQKIEELLKGYNRVELSGAKWCRPAEQSKPAYMPPGTELPEQLMLDLPDAGSDVMRHFCFDRRQIEGLARSEPKVLQEVDDHLKTLFRS